MCIHDAVLVCSWIPFIDKFDYIWHYVPRSLHVVADSNQTKWRSALEKATTGDKNKVSKRIIVLYRRTPKGSHQKSRKTVTLADGVFPDFDAFALECGANFAALPELYTMQGKILVGYADARHIANEDFKSGFVRRWSSMPNQTFVNFIRTHVEHVYFPQASSLVPAGVVPHRHIVHQSAVQQVGA